MKPAFTQPKVALFMFAALAVLTFATARGVKAQALPTPQVQFGGTEDYETEGKQWTRYKLAFVNRADYAIELFAAAPDLPPCGTNKKSARTWVDIYNRQDRKRIYGFCALDGPTELGHLWFALEKGTPPPESVYLTITDRRTNTRATSNVVAISSPVVSTGANAPTTTTDALPDLVIQRFSLLDPATGDVSILVTNIGKGSAGQSTLRLIVWQAGQFEQKEAKTVFVKVPALASHKWAVVRAKAGVPIINTKYSMFIDISEEVTESNENNNRREGEAGNFKP
jgi:hypothetical protein